MEKVRPWCGQHSDRGRLKRIRGFLNDMRYINLRFTYLLTYLLKEQNRKHEIGYIHQRMV